MTRRATEFDRLGASPPSRTTTADEWLRVPELDAAADVVAEAPGQRQRSRPAPTSVPPRRPDQPDAGEHQPSVVVAEPARTSAAAVCALACGVAALVSTLTLVLAPVGIALGAAALILGIVGTGRAGVPHLTGRGTAVAGIAAGVVGLLVGIAVVVGALVWAGDGTFEIEQRIGDVDIEVRR